MSGLEIIGGAVAIIQLLEYGKRARSCFLDLVKKADNPAESLEELSNYVESIIDHAKSIKAESSELAPIGVALRRCIKNSLALEAMLKKIRLDIAKNGRGKSKGRIWMVATWKWREKEIENAWNEIHDSITTLQFFVSCGNRNILHRIEGGLGSLKLPRENILRPSGSVPDLRIVPSDCLQTDPHSRADSFANMVLSRYSTVPTRNPYFVGRRKLLAHMTRILQPGDEYMIRTAIYGLGGIGKSQLVIECAHQIQEESLETRIIFSSASSELEFEQSYAEFASCVHITTDNDSLLVICEKIKNYLESNEAGKWLMIVDGLDGADALFGPKELHKYLPQSKYGSIVFTTRNKQLVHELIPLEERLIQLNRLSTEDALSFLQTRLGNLEEKRKPMLELIDLLEGLPLALSQASSFISRNSYNIDQYVRLYRRSDTTKIELLNNGGSRLDGSLSNPVTKTWQISFENIRDKSSLAARILSFGACLHPQRIPLNLLPSSESPVEVVDALGLLRAYSMVTSNASDDSITMHSLVHLVTRHRLRSEAQLEEYVQMSFDSVYHNFPERFERQEELLDGDQYSLHVQTVLDNGLLTAQGPRRCHVLLASRTSHYFRGKGEYDISLRYAKMATDWCHLASSKEDACTMSRINDLAVANWYHGDYKEAETAAREVLDLRKQVLGHEHKDTLATLNNLGLILHAQGKYETAEEIHQRALEIREKTLGANHNETLKSLNNLGLSLKRQQKYVEAEKAFRRVSIERRAMFGTAHVSTLVPLNNLGLVLELRERHEEAFAVHSEVLCAREALHGTGHPETLKSKQNMAVVLRKQGQLERADIMMREVLAKYVQALGEKHPDVLYAMSSLATLHQERGKYQDAEDLSRQVFQTRRDQLGENHPDAIFSENQWKEVRKKNFENTNATLELD